MVDMIRDYFYFNDTYDYTIYITPYSLIIVRLSLSLGCTVYRARV